MSETFGSMSARSPHALALLATYKLAKGALQLTTALALGVLLLRHPDELPTLAREGSRWLLRHATARWSVVLAEALSVASTPHAARLTALALLADGALTTVEGAALRRGETWGEWLVVATTGLPLPFELWALAKGPSLGHAALLVANVVILLYLLRRRWREA